MLTTLQPLLQAEFRHQRFIIQRGRVGLLWIILAALLIIPALLATLSVMWTALTATNAPDAMAAIGISASSTSASLGLVAVLVASISMSVVVMFITYGLAANSISREKRGNTWDNLVLTRATPFVIVLGKWIASLRAVWGDHVMAIFLRAGLVTYAFLALRLYQYNWQDTGLVIIVLWALTAWYGVLDAALSASLGILGALQEGAVGAVMGLLLVSVRLAMLALALIWAYIALLMSLSSPQNLLLHTLIGTGMYAAIVLGVLWLAQRRI